MFTKKYEILFDLKGQKTSIQGEINFQMKKYFKTFINKLKLNDKNLRFEYNNREINEEITLEEFVTINIIENNKIEIKVIEKGEDENIISSEEIICPQCKQEARIIVSDDKITLICNHNRHHISEIPKTEFIKSQMIDKSSIKCKCEISSTNTKRFCLTCKEILCTFCEKEHIKNNNEHIIINYNQRNYYCLEHNESKNQFNCYCKTCKKNLCWICNKFHKNHQAEELNEIYYLKSKIISKHKANSSILKKYEGLIEELIKELENFKASNEINEYIIKNYNIDNRNYIKINNIKEIYEKNFNLKKLSNRVKYLENIIKNNNNYQEINFNNDLSKIKIEEMIKKQNKEIKECRSIISFNISQFLSKCNNLLHEKIINNNEINNNINLSENYKKSNENEKNNDESAYIMPDYEKNNINENEKNNDESANRISHYQFMPVYEKNNINENEKNNDENANRISNFNDIMPVYEKNNINENENKKENEEQEDEELSEIKVNNNTKTIGPFYENIGEHYYRQNNKIIPILKENENNVKEGNIKSCYINDKKEEEEEYNDNDNDNYIENNQIIKEKQKIKNLMEKKRNSNVNVENHITLIYNTKSIQGEKIRIFGQNFVKNNHKKCKFIYKEQKYALTEYFEIPKDNKGDLEIFLEGIDKITDASGMFSDCSLLCNLDDISEWDTSNITDMSFMFRNCTLLSLPDLSKWNLINVTNIKYMFSGCKSLKSLPDLSGWNTNRIINMSNLFEDCESLISLPDLSKWNMKNVINIDSMFKGCKSLSSLPDLSKWDIKNVTSIENMFHECKSLEVLPDLSRWNVSNATNMRRLFMNCISLTSLPDMSKWDIKNLTNIQEMFSGCLKVKKIKIFKNSNKLEYINELFYGCNSLKNMPDIKGLNLDNIKDKKNINGNCFNLNNNKV